MFQLLDWEEKKDNFNKVDVSRFRSKHQGRNACAENMKSYR